MPNIMQLVFKLSKIDKPIDKKIINKINASALFNDPLARGRFFVLTIFESIFLSIISLMIHPAERIIKDPKANKTKSCISTFPSEAIINAQKVGNINSHIPVGLFILIKIKKFFK